MPMPANIHPFDLQSRAALASRALTGLLDPEREGLMYFLANWRAQPVRAFHGLWDCGDGCGRHIDALTLARTMVRAGSPAAVGDRDEAQIEAWMLRFLGEDGLSWLPAEPWAAPWCADRLLVNWQPGQEVAEISWAQRGTLMGLLSRYLHTRDEEYLDRARRLVDGMLRVSIRREEGLLLPEGYYRRDGWGFSEPNLRICIEEYNAAAAIPALRLYEVTGYAPALELAEGLIRFALAYTQGYDAEGRFVPGSDLLETHFHTRSNFILCVLKLGLMLDEQDLVNWARWRYEHARTWGTDFGWFPEGIGQRHGEVCCTTDMVEIALLLGGGVDKRYYADAERYGRNALLESQFLSLDDLQAALDRMPADATPAPNNDRDSTTDNVAARQLGGFASRPALNDAFHLDATALMQCCNAAGLRGLYDLWSNAVHETVESDGHALYTIHLRFSVETAALRVLSHEPTTGRLTIDARQTGEVAVRLPEGTSMARVAPADRDDAARDLQAREGYVRFNVRGGESVTVSYPLVERVATYQVGSAERSDSCTGYWRGETLLRVEPPGRYLPLYTRRTDLGPAIPAPSAAPAIPSL